MFDMSLLTFLFGPDGVNLAIPIAPLIGAGLSIAGSAGLFGGRQRQPTFDISGIQRQLRLGGQEQRGIVTGLRPQLQPFTEQFQARLGEALAQRKAGGLASREQLLAGVTDVGGQQATLRRAELQKQVLGLSPQLQQQILEAQAATGGIQRGSTQVQLGQLAQQQGVALAGGLADIEGQRLAQEQQVNEIIFGAEERELQEVLGIDTAVAQQLLQLGRGDLLQEAAELLEISRAQQQGQLALAQIQAGQQFAQQAESQRQRGLLQQGLIGAGTQLLGFGLTRGAGVQPVQTTQGQQLFPEQQFAGVARRTR